MADEDLRFCRCEGWWHQGIWGQQPMQELRIAFDGGRIRGSGVDCVGLFTLTGTIDSDGGVQMHKRYLGQHGVLYAGTYDGEGVMRGQWRLDGDHGEWLIRIGRLEQPREAEEFLPPQE